ncbi:hypothetical protein BDR26DRAFT_965140 [Obelidium mucronatum]|nr:hypothetical protein BDR26DRAFT_965140 [Obelidium mucronatum]
MRGVLNSTELCQSILLYLDTSDLPNIWILSFPIFNSIYGSPQFARAYARRHYSIRSPELLVTVGGRPNLELHLGVLSRIFCQEAIIPIKIAQSLWHIYWFPKTKGVLVEITPREIGLHHGNLPHYPLNNGHLCIGGSKNEGCLLLVLSSIAADTSFDMIQSKIDGDVFRRLGNCMNLLLFSVIQRNIYALRYVWEAMLRDEVERVWLYKCVKPALAFACRLSESEYLYAQTLFIYVGEITLMKRNGENFVQGTSYNHAFLYSQLGDVQDLIPDEFSEEGKPPLPWDYLNANSQWELRTWQRVLWH